MMPHDVQSIAQSLYNLTVDVSQLPGELDLNFRLTDAEGTHYVLKVMRPGCDPSLIELQTNLLRHVAQQTIELTLPHVIPTIDDQLFAPYQGRLVWMLSWVDGTVLAHIKHHEPTLLANLGRTLALLDQTLLSFAHPAAHRQMKWDLSQPTWIADYLPYLAAEDRRLIERILADFAALNRDHFRRSIVHNDANDYNILIDGTTTTPIDFGDAIHTHTINELAIACAYALLDKPDPIDACTHLIRGYHAVLPITEAEADALLTLIKMRLAVSVTNSAYQKTLNPDDPYIVISERPAWDALRKLKAIHPTSATAKFRAACGYAPHPNSAAVVAHLQRLTCSPVIKVEPSQCIPLDLAIDSLNVQWHNGTWHMREEALDGGDVYIGGYDEARLIYTNALFGDGHPTCERRTIHLGCDMWAASDTPIYAPIDGIVHTVARNDQPLDYGPVIILAHVTDDGIPFYTLYGHLSVESLTMVAVGQTIKAGQQIGTLGTRSVNGGWPPHLHLQIMVDLLEMGSDFPGVAPANERDVWLALSPNPDLILERTNDATQPAAQRQVASSIGSKLTKAETMRLRQKYFGRNLSISYRNPLKIVRGHRQFLYDETGRAFLDCYNNVAHVGHSHPQVVAAVQAQAALLNTNTRYLHDNLVRYAERLVGTLPEPLSVVYIVNSGSEANELALRLAHTFTNSKETIVLDNAYHGHTTTLIDVSPYKHNGPGGKGAPDWVHTVPIADDYRGPFKRSDPAAGINYARQVLEAIGRIEGQLACFMAETLPSVGGQIVFPPGYLAAVQQHVHAAGGLMIADEVQVGFGRLGTHYWGFETQAFVPDIVALGKPIANGFPMAAVITTPEIAAAFDNGMEYFATFGGNPVSVAAGLAVMDVVEQEQLQENARRRGLQLLDGFKQLQTRHEIIGDVRGMGLFLGLELVRDRQTLEPAASEASAVVNRLRERGVLAGTDGPFHNVIKLRGPMCLNATDADLLIELLDWALP